MNYLTEDDLIRSVLNSMVNFCDPDLVDRRVLPIENYEMLIVGYGKFVLLRERGTMEQALRMEYFKSEEQKAANPEGGRVRSKFIALCMPQGSDSLEMFY